MYCSSDVYSRSTHDNAKAKFTKACTQHHICTAAVRELILNTIKAVQADSTRAEKFIELVKRYTDFSEITNSMINEFVLS